MKKWTITAAIILFSFSLFGQEATGIKKDEKKQEKVDKKAAKMEKQKRERHGKKSLKKQDKSEKKEAVLTNGAGK